MRNSWYVDFRYGYKRYRFKSKVNTKSGAMAYEAHLYSKLLAGKPIHDEPREKPMTFEQFSRLWIERYAKANNKYSEIISKESVLKNNLLPFFGKLPLDKITSMKIEEYKFLMIKKRSKRTGGILSAKTLRNHLSILRKCLNTAVEWEYLEAPPLIRMPKTSPSGYRYLTYEESERLLRATSGRWHDMILLALKAGLRFGEIIALTWRDFDFENMKLCINKSVVRGRLGSTKTYKTRYVDLHERIRQCFQNKMQEKENLVFPSEVGGFINQKRACDELERIYKRAGLQPIGWHALRHTCASHLASKGAPLLAVQTLLGHSDIQTTMRYAHLCPSVGARAISLLE